MNSVPKEDGVYYDLSRELYDQIVDRVNWSRLKLVGKSPAHYQHEVLEPEGDKEAYVLGRATHHATYEPELFQASYLRWDMGRRAGKDWTDFVARAEREQKTILTEAQHEEALQLGRAIREGMAKKWVTRGKSEVTLLYTLPVEIADIDPATGEVRSTRIVNVKMKSRPDFISDAESMVDLKTCRDASREAFGKAVINYDYLGQAALYRRGWQILTGKLFPYRIVAAEKKSPWVVQVYRVKERHMDMGEGRFRELLVELVRARESNNWRGYFEDEVDLELPHWADPDGQDSPDAMGLTF